MRRLTPWGRMGLRYLACLCIAAWVCAPVLAYPVLNFTVTRQITPPERQAKEPTRETFPLNVTLGISS
jgi:hypothetical protein